MKRKIISVLLALVLVLSFSLVTAVPVAAQATLNVHPLELDIKTGDSTAQWSTTQFKNGSYSAYLDTGTTTQGDGDEARIEITMPAGTTLNDITSISWWVYAASGYPPHIDITLDCDGDSVVDNEDMLTAEMNLNCVGAPVSIATLTGQISYNTGWVQTFELTSGDGFGAITDSTTFWVTKMGSGDLNAPSGTLAQWKAGVVANDPESEMTTPVITGSAPVVKLEIEVDNWVVNSDVYVDDVAINGVVWYGLIQDAIDTANAGDTINVADGTYTENIVVDESLTIQAASTPIIDGDGALGPGVHITAADVTFRGFTITNFTCTPTAGIGAMLVEGDGAVIDGNIIYDITTTGDPINDPAGIGIDVHASNVEVTNNIVHDVGSIGIRVRHDWDTAPTVSNNVLLEKNDVYRTANTGVLVTGYAKGVTIRENEIYESLEPTPYSLFVHYGAEDVLIENNIIRDPYNSIYGHNLVLAGCDNVTISGNTITGATSGKNIYLLSDYLPWVDAELLSTNVNIINNDIQNGAWGVRMDNAAATDPSQMPATTTINFNNISGNTSYGVENAIATAVDAEYNWYGGVAGPQHSTNPYNTEAGNQGNDNVSDNVDFLPWMIHDTLVSGWNIWSTPIAPATGLAGEPDTNTVAEALDFWGADSSKVIDVYYFNSATQAWVIPTSLTPLQAVYLNLSASATIDVCVSDSNYAPPGRTMHLGWNLVGTADWDDDKLVDIALLSAEYGTGAVNLIGYQYVISPSIHQTSWTFTRGGTAASEYFIPTEGYWVFMVNQGTLGGFTYTPIAP